MKVPGALWRLLLLAACLAFFIDRGPYRAIRFSTTGDFSSLYAAARCWAHGADPYDRVALKAELARAGAPRNIQADQDINPSVYLPAAMPWALTVAWMRWGPANALWCVSELVLFGVSIVLLLKKTQVSSAGKVFAACGVLLFSPTYVGIYDGNPSVIAISLIALSVCLVLDRRTLLGGICLGIAMCFKPQLALCVVCLLVIWRRARPIWIGAVVFSLAAFLGVAVVSQGGRDWRWWHTEQQNIAVSLGAGGTSDPAPKSAMAWQLLNSQTLAAYALDTRQVCNAVVWLLSTGLATIFLLGRRRWVDPDPWHDVAFFSTVTLTFTYHRYYDAQILLLLLPFLACLWHGRERKVILLAGVCLLVLAFPIQSVFARRLGAAAIVPSPSQFILLRNQPAAVLALAILLAICCQRHELYRASSRAVRQ